MDAEIVQEREIIQLAGQRVRQEEIIVRQTTAQR